MHLPATFVDTLVLVGYIITFSRNFGEIIISKVWNGWIYASSFNFLNSTHIGPPFLMSCHPFTYLWWCFCNYHFHNSYFFLCHLSLVYMKKNIKKQCIQWFKLWKSFRLFLFVFIQQVNLEGFIWVYFKKTFWGCTRQHNYLDHGNIMLCQELFC